MNGAAPILADWIAVDWGTTNLRAWAMVGDQPIATVATEQGMATLAREAFEPALLAAIGPWLVAGRVTPVVACGMVGSRQGWVEAGYEPVPGPPRRKVALANPGARDPRIDVHILHGLKQADPADVMRGEETQLAGLLAREPGFDGIACLPGTHSKWVRLAGGDVAHFATFMTGETFSLMAKQSVLRHTISEGGWSETAFASAVEDALNAPEKVAAHLFGLRAASLLGSLDPVAARSRLSGLLIGQELAASTAYWHGRDVVLIGADAVCRPYAAALSLCGVATRSLDVTDMTLAGLTAAHDALQSMVP